MCAKEIALRYGVNPHQKPARAFVEKGELPFRALNGAPGYINLMDLLNGWQLVREMKEATGLPAAASFKHVSPAGAAIAVPMSPEVARASFVDDLDLSPLATAYARARGADRLSSFGDAVALSDPCDVQAARLIAREVSDCVVAPGFAPEAVEILKGKSGGRYLVLEIDPSYEPASPVERREIFGVALEQPRNTYKVTPAMLAKVVTKLAAFPAVAVRDMMVCTVALKYTQSNSVGFAYDGQVIGMGAGQQSRLHCVRLAAQKADLWHLRQHPEIVSLKFKKTVGRADRNNLVEQLLVDSAAEPFAGAAWKDYFVKRPKRLSASEKHAWLDTRKGVSVSSDAFFPFRDSIDRAAESGAEYVLEPGGSKRDEDVIKAADEHGMVMAFSGVRLFHH
jgi:phosphoribosylaminoimidazolecarboxamide formyltransferase/IMP cyclohydrolase/phosphoribosylaminoimidazolecarboxamide formyltransferase